MRVFYCIVLLMTALSLHTGLAARRFLLVALLALFSSMANAVLVDNRLVVGGSQYLQISDDAETSLLAKRNSVVDIIAGGYLEKAVARHNAVLTIDGGSVDHVVASGYSSVNIFSGSFSKITAKKNSSIVLSNLTDLSRLVLKGDAVVDIMASDLDFDGRFLTGVWDNGSAFSIRTVNKTGVTNDNFLGYLLPSDTGGPQAVPVPAAAWMFLSALTGLGLVGRRRK